MKLSLGLVEKNHILHQVVNSYLVWGAVGIHFSVQYSKIHHQKFVNEFLLSVVK